jgi:hypothetical protein
MGFKTKKGCFVDERKQPFCEDHKSIVIFSFLIIQIMSRLRTLSTPFSQKLRVFHELRMNLIGLR